MRWSKCGLVALVAGWWGAAALAACAPAPAGPHDIEANTFYTDAHHSVVDPDRYARYRASVAPIEDYLQQLTLMADAAVLRGDGPAAACAVRWLQSWAEQGALTGAMRNPQGGTQAEYVRKWTLAGLSLAYLKVRSAATASQHASIARWMQMLADRSLAVFDNPKLKRNNHYYWVGLAAMGTGVATDSPRLRAAARQVFAQAMQDVQDDGSLPLEMDRAALALHYHHYALAPLALMLRLAQWQGEDWRSTGQERLDLLQARVVGGLGSPAWFAQRSGVAQKAVTGTVRCWAVVTAVSGVAPPGTCHYKHFGGSTVALAQVLGAAPTLP